VYRSNPLSAASVRCFIRKPSDALLNLSSTPVENGELNQSLPRSGLTAQGVLKRQRDNATLFSVSL
jgi:hypothetical protein